MAWVMNSNPIHSTFSSLFVQNGDDIIISEDCLEYLVSVEVRSNTDVEKHTIFELNKLLTSSKEVFAESKSTKAVVDHMKFIVESDSQLNLEQCDNINNCLLLLRNILHIPENREPSSNGFSHTSMQNQIMWNLFTQSIDKIIIYLMSCSQRVYWGVTLVQLIALMYKDQHVGTLQKLLNLWLEACYSDSSEDNESNTSPPDQGSDDSSPVITSDPTSDSSDTGSNGRNKSSNNNTNNRVTIDRSKNTSSETIRTSQTRNKNINTVKRNKSTETETSTSSGVSSMGHSTESNDGTLQSTQSQQALQNSKRSSICQSNQSEISDCGYVTQMENQESISTSSNEDDQPHQKPVHQKPPIFQKTRYNSSKNRTTTTLDKKELRRKKLVKRRKTNIINMKGLIHHLPTDEDIANILKEFTVDFLLKGYGTLVNDLHTELISNIHIQIDTSHFFWLVTYFLKFAVQLELDPEHISPVLSYRILSYLVFQGIWVCEELEISYTKPDYDLKPCLRRLHLVVTAIREFLQGVEAYQKMIHLSDNDKDHLAKLQAQIVKLKDLKMLFVLLLRHYKVNLQSKQYLQDLILTNHNFFLFLDNASTTPKHNLSMMEGHQKSASPGTHFKNYCFFLPRYSSLDEILMLFRWTKEEKDNLLKYYNQNKESSDTITKIIESYEASGFKFKSQISIIEELLEQNIISENEYNDLRRQHRIERIDSLSEDEETKDIMEDELGCDDSLIDSDTKVIKEYLYKENKGKFLIWLQEVLLEVCYVKLVLGNPEEFKGNENLLEPTVYNFALSNLPIPLIPWTVDQANILKHQPFILLLHKLGFYLPADTGKIFVRIPNFWTPDYVFRIAQLLGPINKGNVHLEMECSPIHATDSDLVLSDERNSNCDTASVASDLTRMCVSDEDDKVVLVLEGTDKIA
uniref:Protein timeless n=1 Tax=Diabrotica virgifera virgifera TaxID=50390 RepID=A0A6P7G1F2_DIAVI